jgi:hypothetical protein
MSPEIQSSSRLESAVCLDMYGVKGERCVKYERRGDNKLDLFPGHHKVTVKSCGN